VLILLASSCNLINTGQNIKLKCSAENLSKDKNDFTATDNNSAYFFSGGKTRSDTEAHTGKFSALASRKHPYVFSITLKNIGPDKFFKVSVWRKSKGNHGALVASDKTAKRLYKITDTPVSREKNGWEKLEMEFFTPPNFMEENIKIYCWSVKGDSVFFDDIVIVNTHKKYPLYKEDPLVIVLDTSDYRKFINKRIGAFNAGILQTESNDWVKGIVFGNHKMMKVKLRLKGDWLDHLIGDKWSFRIKMRKNYAWNRLRVFSVQTPFARGFLYEWYSHQLYIDRDILTTRYGFTPLMMGEKSKGLYAWEEHFTKQLIEYRQRREGPILKFSEDAFWQIQLIAKKTGHWPDLPAYNCSVIEPFSQGKTLKNPVLYREFIIASRLMYQYKYNTGKPADIFDLNRLAKYFAMLDITHARHGMAWHNQRFYYNPVICKLEPIAYDGYTDHLNFDFSITDNMAWQLLSNKKPISEEYNFYHLFEDSAFIKRYLKYLEEYSSTNFAESTSRRLKPKAAFYDSLIRMEFPGIKFDQQFLAKSTRAVRHYLPELKNFINIKLAAHSLHAHVTLKNNTDSTTLFNTPAFYVIPYFESEYPDSMVIGVHNFFGKNIKLAGTSSKKRFIQHYFPKPILLKAYVKGNDGVIKNIVSDPGDKYLFFYTEGSDDLYSVAINPWPYPGGVSPRQELIETSDFKTSPAVDTIIGNRIFIKKGTTILNKNLIIPKGFRVQFNKGTHIDIINHAMIISCSPVFIKGTTTEPVIISSSDGTGNGFTVLQAEKRSQIKYVRFEKMNTLNYKGWTLSGSVTFYESDVDINHAVFTGNGCEDALNIVRSNFILDSSRFSQTQSDAFDSDFSTGLVNNVVFTNIGNDAIDFSGSRIKITNCTINGVKDKGVSGGEDSHLIIENTTVSSANIGLASKDLSSLTVSDSKIEKCKYGLVLLQKKPEYGPATMELNKVIIKNSEMRMLIEKGSEVVFNGKTIHGDKKKVAKMFY
jgi:hypothetical protein